MHDEKLREGYYAKIQSEIEKFDKDENFFYDTVNKNVNDTFFEAFMSRLQDVYKKSEEAHSIDKRRMFLRLKKWYFRERILQYGTERLDQIDKQIESMPWKQIHLSEKWD
jgi:superfamily I DNA and RNA helicase